MKAVILAAGKGKRMGSITKKLPKCLLKFDNKTIIEMQIDILNKNGIEDIIVVTGFKRDLVRDVLKDRVKYVVNDIYDQSNSSYSLYLAREGLKKGWLHMNCDLLFSPDILKKILESKSARRGRCLEDSWGLKMVWDSSSLLSVLGRTSRWLATALVLKTSECKKPCGFDPLSFRL